MNKRFNLLFAFSLSGCLTAIAQHNLHIHKIAENLVGPVALAATADGTGRLIVCEQTGKIKVIKSGKVLEKVFLNVSDRLDNLNKVYSEKGLLGIAFHPQFKANGRFFIYYSAPSEDKSFDHKSVLAEYHARGGADVADARSGKILLEINEPESNHNGGQLAFGPDGYLYIGVGDGGGAGDNHGNTGNGQDLSTLLGKILRIDVNGAAPYSIPKDNPFLRTKGARPEIWAYGLRNPWRFSFDKKTGRLFCGDVGQDKFEEIDIIEKGKNYGWRIMEGAHCFNPAKDCNQQGLQLPIAEYGRNDGISVTGGYLYRGKIGSLTGKYIFGDWKGNMYYLEESGGKWQRRKLTIDGKDDLNMNINSFGEDENGDLYLLTQKSMGTLLSNGKVYRLETR
jgi:glucose/arabinose dehydrogenase